MWRDIDFATALKDTDTVNHNLKEALAKQAHDSWTGWMTYLFSKCERTFVDFDSADEVPEADRPFADSYGVVEYCTIPRALVERWQRQMATEYEELSEAEKASDREEGEKYWNVVREMGFGPY